MNFTCCDSENQQAQNGDTPLFCKGRHTEIIGPHVVDKFCWILPWNFVFVVCIFTLDWEHFLLSSSLLCCALLKSQLCSHYSVHTVGSQLNWDRTFLIFSVVQNWVHVCYTTINPLSLTTYSVPPGAILIGLQQLSQPFYSLHPAQLRQSLPSLSPTPPSHFHNKTEKALLKTQVEIGVRERGGIFPLPQAPPFLAF